MVFADEKESKFQRANSLYDEKKYTEAIKIYESILDEDFISDAIYFNMGNSYYKLGNIGKAILYYERAIKLNRDDSDILFNLKLSKNKTVDNIEELPIPITSKLWDSLTSVMQYEEWGYISVISSFLFAVLFSLFYLRSEPNIKKTAFIISIMSLVVMVLSVAISDYIKNNMLLKKQAIVMVNNTYIKGAPSSHAKDVFMLHEGAKVCVLDEIIDWKKIELPDGKTGWATSKDLEDI
ncbi:BatE protein [Ichthyobacterium seriolicida]|uniref:BatE protein n=2 Tax=Ichthyobacterium seriolicida TaxID=242600 RepID=A0A1J1DW03_9FLAO|nr:BatE protein [Ichthyobacterium seriolicida]